MTYRDDHEAALARVDALQQELEREQGDDAERDRRIAELERELGEARKKLERAEQVLADVKRETPEPEPKPELASSEPTQSDLRRSSLRPPELAPEPAAPESPLAKRPWAIMVVPLVFLLVIIAIVASQSSESKSKSPREPTKPQPPVVRATPDEISGYLVDARERARGKLSGSVLVAINAEGVARDGTLHPSYGKVTFEFERADPPERYQPDSETPIGAPHREPSPYPTIQCRNFEYDARGYREGVLEDFCVGTGYEARSEQDPVCTMRAVWDMAIAGGAPANAIAAITFDGMWHFVIDDPRASYRNNFTDSCQLAEQP